MAQSATSFRSRPEFQRGREGEIRVAHILQERGWHIIPSYDYAGEEGDVPPRLQGADAAYPVPDLDISRDGERRWAEVKTKAHADWTHITKRLEHGIPLRHYQAYLDVERITGTPVWLFVVEGDTGLVLSAPLKELGALKRVYVGPKMSRGGMVYFPRDAFEVVTDAAQPTN